MFGTTVLLWYYFECLLVFCFCFFSHHVYLSLCCRDEFLSVIVTHSVCRYGETHGDDGVTSGPAPSPGEK